MSQTAKSRRFTNIHVLQIIKYRLPAAGMISILHRISGAALFLLLPFLLFLFDKSITSEISYAFLQGYVSHPLVKLFIAGCAWAYLHHFIAGLRHLYMDVCHAVSKEFGKSSAIVTLSLSIGLPVVLGAKLFGIY